MHTDLKVRRLNPSGLPAHPLRGRAARKGHAGHGARHTGASMRPHAAPQGLGWKAGAFAILIRVHPWLNCFLLCTYICMFPVFIEKKQKIDG